MPGSKMLADLAGAESAAPPRDAPAAEERSELQRLGDALLLRLEAERERVSTHLHTEVEPLVIAVKLRVEDALHRLGDAAPEVAALLAEVPGSLRGLVDDLRETAGALRPNLFDERGLMAALAWQCDRFAHAHPEIGLLRRLTVQDGEVPPAARLDILRIVQEALCNVERHAGASWVRVGLYREGDALHLMVEDNGNGRVGGHAAHSGGLGLALIRRRAQRSGGRLQLRGTEGQGAQLHVSWKPVA